MLLIVPVAVLLALSSALHNIDPAWYCNVLSCFCGRQQKRRFFLQAWVEITFYIQTLFHSCVCCIELDSHCCFAPWEITRLTLFSCTRPSSYYTRQQSIASLWCVYFFRFCFRMLHRFIAQSKFSFICCRTICKNLGLPGKSRFFLSLKDPYTANCKISFLVFSPPENPSLTFQNLLSKS